MDKRYLKAGRYLVVDLDTGEARKFTRYTGIEKRKRRIKFVEKHWRLCKAAWEIDHWHKGGTRTAAGIKVVQKARKELKLSEKTGSGDIFVLIMHTFADSGRAKPSNLCECGWCRSMMRSKRK